MIWLGPANRDSDIAMDSLVAISAELDSTAALNELTLVPKSGALQAPNSVVKSEVSAAINSLFKRP